MSGLRICPRPRPSASASLRPKPAVQRLLRRPRTRLGKSRPRQPRLRDRLLAGLSVGGRQRLREQEFQARIVVQMVCNPIALDEDARLPAWTALPRLIAPLDEMQQEDFESADELAFFGSPHAVDFLGDMLDVGLGESAGSQQFGLLAAPGIEIAVVKRASCGHVERILTLAPRVYSKRNSSHPP